MSRHHLARGFLAIGLSLGVLASSLVLGVGRSATLAGTPSECYLLVSGADKIFDTHAYVVPQEATHVWGDNWTVGQNVTFTIRKVGSSTATTRSVPINAAGEFQDGFFPPNNGVGKWRFTVNQTTPACNVTIEATVLPLLDIVNSKFLGDIKWLFVEGITSGCTSTTFCPNGLVTRAQMATFLVRALNLPATSTDYFTDDEGSTHEGNINRLRASGITMGCGGTNFCPSGVVTRGQMATFLVRAFDLPSTSNDYFTDDEGSTHEPNINRLRASGITSGCGGTNFCPNGQVTRGQMAAFLHRAME
jgi:hypothetical protein